MAAQIVTVNPAEPREERLGTAVTALEQGEMVAIPTETFYGIAADAFNDEAIRAVNRLKGKDEQAPVLLLLSDTAQVRQVCREPPGLFAQLSERFWPGPLTLVVPASPEVPPAVSGGTGRVAVRVPGLTVARHLARLLGRPISGVSANRTGEPPCRTAGDVARTFPTGLAVIVDGGRTPGGAPSTILDLCGVEPKVLRDGLVPPTSLRPYLNGHERRRL